jgi:molecular chaperone DnaJ
LALTQAVLGAALKFETLDGVEDLVIPQGTQPGTQFRLRSRGVPDVRGGNKRGDLIVTVVVEIPTHLDGEQEDLFRKIAELRGEDVSDRDHGIFSKIKSAFK